MKARIFLFALLAITLSLASKGFAQGQIHGTSVPMKMEPASDSVRDIMVRRAMLGETTGPQKSYADSVQFKKAFNEFYPSVEPKETLKQRVTDQFIRLYPAFKSRGVDSVAAWKAVMKELDTTHDRQIYYNAYRQIFTAEEMKEYAKFAKTSAGKKMLENEMTIGRVSGQTVNYPMMVVSRGITSVDKRAPTGGPLGLQGSNPPGILGGGPARVLPSTDGQTTAPSQQSQSIQIAPATPSTNPQR